MIPLPLRGLVALVVALVLPFGLAACGGDDESGSGSGSGGGNATSESGGEEGGLRVAMVTDIGGLNDRSFNASAYKGLQAAEKELGTEIRAVTSASNADYVPNLSTLARQRYDLVIAVGFLMAEATEKVAKSFPNTRFAIIDYPQTEMKSKPDNVKGLLFKEAEAGYLVGTMAGHYVKDQGGPQVISSVGGQQIPPVDAYIAGYMAGAKEANPKIKVLNAYSQDFVDQAKCKEIALNHIEQGAQVVFQVAGQCGLGALDAAKDQDKQGIGVDADQAYLGPHIMTSALKKIDEAVLQTITDLQNDQFEAGDTIFDVKSEGVGYGKTNDVGAKYEDQVKKVQEQIAGGELADIPTTVE
jgi:basic membrane protein A